MQVDICHVIKGAIMKNLIIGCAAVYFVYILLGQVFTELGFIGGIILIIVFLACVIKR